jgi:hypothetical protein
VNIKIVNCTDKKFRPYVKRALEFYGKQLITSEKLRNNITLNIKFNKKLQYWALASIEDYNSNNKAREFLIEIHPWIGAKEILRTLAHEMVHIRQFAYGETNSSLDVWRGIPIDSAKMDYYLHPWELDAYGMETGLFTKYVVSEKLWDVFEDLVDPDSPITEYPIKWKKVEILDENNKKDTK